MRIGIDMLGAQSELSQGRGIGRYSRNLVAALAAHSSRPELVLYTHDNLPTRAFPIGPRITVRPLPYEATARATIERVVQADPDRVDAFLLLSPFEPHRGYDPPAPPADGPPLAAVLYDLILFLFQERYLVPPAPAMRFYRNLERVGHADALLCISEATAADARRVLGLGDDRIVNIGGASDPDFFVPDRSWPLSELAQNWLERLKVDCPFLFCVASPDERKNFVGLLDAFALLPRDLRDRHQIVLTSDLTGEASDQARRMAAERGLSRQLRLTGVIPDEALRVLYQRCAAFVFPSKYEGLGLPILEAMLCGAAVVAGDNSSQPEVVGDAGLLADADEPADIAESVRRILVEPGLAESLGVRARERAMTFRWDDVAGRTLAVLEQIAGHGPTTRRTRPRRPRLAVVSPWPPRRSGVADYTYRLSRSLSRHYRIEVYHDTGRLPELGDLAAEFPIHDWRLLPRQAAHLGYRGILYQMGNSEFHHHIYQLMERCPGVVTLHDYCLVGFHIWLAVHCGLGWDGFARELEHSHPGRAAEMMPLAFEQMREGIHWNSWFSSRGLYMNRRIFERARAVIVHSEWCRDRVAFDWPEDADRTFVIPHGAEPRPGAVSRRAAARERFGLPQHSLLVGSFGILDQSKMNLEAMRSFRLLADRDPSARYLLVGRDGTDGAVAAAVAELGLEDRVRFVGHATTDDYEAGLDAVDLAFCLRRPPTNGETSGALLDLLRSGVPTIIVATGSFGSFPGTVVKRVHWESEGQDGLDAALLELATDPRRRRELSKEAARMIEKEYDWELVADRYREVIERAHRRRPGGASYLAEQSRRVPLPALIG